MIFPLKTGLAMRDVVRAAGCRGTPSSGKLVLVRTTVRLGHPPALTPAPALPRLVTYSHRRGSSDLGTYLRPPATGRGRSWPSILTSLASGTDTPPSPR